MGEPDVVTEIDGVLNDHWPRTVAQRNDLLQRARDEIEALREFTASSAFGRRIRAEALEEAAQVCEQESETPGQLHSALRCATAIRALKDKAQAG